MHASAPVRTALASLVLAAFLGLSIGCSGGVGEPGSGAADGTTSTTAAQRARDVDELEDGTHQVRIREVDLVGGTVVVDGVQVMEGMEAVLAYLADTDGAQLEGPQVYVRNGVESAHEFGVDTTGSFSVIPADACCEPTDVGWSAFADAASRDFDGLWGSNPPFEVRIEDGVLVSAVQIHVP